MTIEHKKHAALARPSLGQFGRYEMAFVGTDCGSIRRVCGQLAAGLSSTWKTGFVDAAHPKTDSPEPLPGLLETGAALDFSDNISHRQFLWKADLNPFQRRPIFNEIDLVLINGNHFEGKKQAVFIDLKKEKSLLKRLGQLTDVAVFILAEGQTEPFDWLKIALPDWQNIPVFEEKDADGLLLFFETGLKKTVAPLCGLILAGGKSVRMGRDKTQIEWHDGQPQTLFLMDLMKKAGLSEVFISCRAEQAEAFSAVGPVLADSFLGLGPFGAICSAFLKKPDSAWLVIACDLPFLDEAALRFLIEKRNPSRLATSFKSPTDGLPEPLVAIWEPKSWPVLLQFLGQGYSCPRKVLRNSEVELVQPVEPDWVMNVNTPGEFEQARSRRFESIRQPKAAKII